MVVRGSYKPLSRVVMVTEVAQSRVLLVEDDPDTRDVMSRLLRRAHWDVDTVTTVGEALLFIKQSAPSSLPTHVLLDLMLPDATGLVFLQYVRRLRLPMRVAVVTASGPDSAIVADAKLLNPDALFHKPAVFSDIEAWLNRD